MRMLSGYIDIGSLTIKNVIQILALFNVESIIYKYIHVCIYLLFSINR